MIIVEGPDGAGKTVLAGLISKKYPQLAGPNYELKRSELHKKDVRGRVYRALAEAIRGTRPLLHDRLFWSELVYGPILRGDCKFKVTEQELIVNLFAALNVPIIFCIPPFEVVKQNVGKDEHITGVGEHVAEIYAAYSDVFWRANQTTLNVVKYDYTADTPEGLWLTLDAYLTQRHEREW
jgi:thymidylate kinase